MNATVSEQQQSSQDSSAGSSRHSPPDYRYSYHIALDGNGVNGLEGMAGVCLFRFDPEQNDYAYKVKYYDGAAAGHAVSINPSGEIGFLGNAGQHLLFYDAHTLDELERISTLQFEPVDTSLQGSTHMVWLAEKECMTPIGRNFYKFHLDNLQKPENLGPHEVLLPHAMKLSASGDYLCYGSMDNPSLGEKGEACHVGIRNMKTGKNAIVKLPATCWHVIAHPSEEKFYAISFRVAPQDYRDYHEWAMSFLKEYVFEIDARTARVSRHWVTGRETPAHINSDITMSDKELIFCNGGSASVVFIDLETMRDFRIIDEKPDFRQMVEHPREVATQVYDIFARGNFFTNSRHFLGALRVSRFSLLDSVYGCQLSPDQSLLFCANRGLNHISIYDYPANTLRMKAQMPELHDYVSGLSRYADPRLGFHHSVLLDHHRPGV